MSFRDRYLHQFWMLNQIINNYLIEDLRFPMITHFNILPPPPNISSNKFIFNGLIYESYGEFHVDSFIGGLMLSRRNIYFNYYHKQYIGQVKVSDLNCEIKNPNLITGVIS